MRNSPSKYSVGRESGRARCEHPWDVGTGWRRIACAAVVVLGGLLFVGPQVRADEESEKAAELKAKIAEAQSKAEAISRESEELKRRQESLKIELVRLLRDQAEMTEELQDLLVDYEGYFEREKSATSQKTIQALQAFSDELRTGNYFENREKLTEDLSLLQEKLQSAENEFRSEPDQRKAARLARSLKRELEIYQGLMQTQGEAQVLFKELSLQMADMSSAVAQDVIRTIVKEGVSSNYVEVMIGDDSLGRVFISLPQLSKEPIVIDVPRATLPPVASPAPPAPPTLHDAAVVRRISTNSNGTISLVQRMSDSLRLDHDKTVVLNVPIGEVKVYGTGTDMIRVTSKIEMESNKRRTLDDLCEDIHLVVTSNDDQVTIQPMVPNLQSSDTRVSQASTIVEIPEGCALNATSSFGTIKIERINNDVIVTGHHSAIFAEDVGGDFTATNRMGSIDARGIIGVTKLNNSSGTVTVNRCLDDIEIKNSLSTTDVSHCEGDVKIHSEGPVTVSTHAGDVFIRNKNGPVTCTRIEGDLDAATSFGPITVESISGDVAVANVSAPLSVSGVSGALTATNRSALLSVRSVTGSLTLSNDGGSTMILMNQTPDGRSTISSNGGMINLTVPRNADMTVASRLVQGQIDTSLPVKIQQEGNVKIATVLLGDGSSEVMIDGTKSTLILSQAR